jgi:hypothetical protein
MRVWIFKEKHNGCVFVHIKEKVTFKLFHFEENGGVLIIGICFMHINYLYLLLLCINHNCYLYMPSCGSDLVNKLILFYSILLYRDMQKVFVTVFFPQSISFKTLQFSKSYPENSNSSHILITFLSTKAKIRAVFK